MAQVREKEIFMNPYVVQMDKFAESLTRLSGTFLKLKGIGGVLLQKSCRICLRRSPERFVKTVTITRSVWGKTGCRLTRR